MLHEENQLRSVHSTNTEILCRQVVVKILEFHLIYLKILK